nr:MAG TPA: hypothetical protein [Caudoviricetes sp.]
MNAIDIFGEVNNVPEVVSSNTISDNKLYGAAKSIGFYFGDPRQWSHCLCGIQRNRTSGVLCGE